MYSAKVVRRLLILILILLSPLGFAAPQVGVRVSPEAWIPYGNDSGIKDTGGNAIDTYSVGIGADLTLDLGLFGFLSPFIDVGAAVIPPNKVSTPLYFAEGGGGLSTYFYPIPRLMTRLGGSGGLAYVSYTSTGTDSTDATSSDSGSGGTTTQGLAYYWKTKLELGYRFTPTTSLLGTVGYSQIFGTAATIYKGISAGLVLDLALGASEGNLDATIKKQEIVFPITYYKSDKTPLATVVLRNRESAEIRDVEVSFSAGAYTSRDAVCGSAKLVQKGDSIEIPIYANFNDKVLGFTETTKLQGTIKVTYKVLDAAKTANQVITVVFNNRNAATWADERVVGAFISPQDPSMLELSKYIAGLVRVHSRTEIDKNLQYGMGLFEGLRVYGIVQTPDPTMPYVEARKDPSKLAYLQYPYQTLSYKSGDSDAIALTMAEALESVAVPSAIAALPEDVIVAFPLDMNELKARTTFSTLSDFIFQDGKVWVPLRASMIRDGFLRSWKEGAALWQKYAADGRKLMSVEDDWKEYQAIALADVDFKPVKPPEDAVNLAFENVLGRFVTAEVQPKIERLLSEMTGDGTGRQRNNLGIVYAQYGLYDQAKAEFEKAVKMGYAPALVNLANVAFLLKDYETAATYFQKALDQQPNNKAAMIGLARAKYELDNFAEADDLFAQVKTIDPKLADQYSYLASKVDVGQALRASAAAADRGGGMTWDEHE
jgi:tetratricopeptide (TPR) repeat protein